MGQPLWLPSERVRAVTLRAAAAALLAGSLALGLSACSQTEPEPQFAPDDALVVHDSRFDYTLGESITVVITKIDDSGTVTFRATPIEGTLGPADSTSTEIALGETGSVLDALVTVCAVWSEPDSWSPLAPAPLVYAYYVYSLDGQTPACPERVK